MILRRSQRGRLLGVAIAAAAIFALSCSGDDYTGAEVFPCPNKAVFIGEPEGGGALVQSVSSFMERRCGTLDCHGASSRPMRLYGQLGRRHPDEDNVVGGATTTRLELEANYAAVCGVEPEKMATVVQDLGASAEDLLLVGKARGIEGHKGGTVVKQNDEADQCIVRWLQNDPLDAVSAACAAAIKKLR